MMAASALEGKTTEEHEFEISIDGGVLISYVRSCNISLPKGGKEKT